MGHKLVMAAAITLTAALTVSGCSAAKPGTPSTGSSGGITVNVGKFSWTAADVTTAILAEITKTKPDLGVADLKTTQLDPATAWAGAKRGDIDLITEVALPNQQKLADSAKDTMQIVSQTYGDAKQGWFVPKYAVEPGGPAAGLTSVTQLNQFSSAFGGKLYDDDPGYITTEQNTKRLAGYGVKYEHVVAGEAAELAQLKKSYLAKQPIVLYLYHPHAVFAQYDMVQLTEPTPYTATCFTTGTGACAMPAYSANIAASTKLKTQAPKFVALLVNFRIPLTDMETMQKSIDIDKKTPTEVAITWVSTHKSQIDGWAKA